MKRIITAIVFAGMLISCNSSNNTKKAKQETTVIDATPIKKQLKKIDTDAALMATALMAAPEESRAGAKVIGYNMAGEFVTFREGTNEFIVLVDDPKKDGFNAACYHKGLEPFMARGRALRAEGKNMQEIFAIRGAEMK